MQFGKKVSELFWDALCLVPGQHQTTAPLAEGLSKVFAFQME